MLDLLQSILMIGASTEPDSPMWPMLAAGVLATGAMMRRISRD